MKNIDFINKYGITLRRLTHDKIELVRYWRTNPKISQFLVYRGEITPEQQEKWFQKINNSNTDFYFIIEIGEKEIGLINIKDIDYNEKCGEPGIFIWDDEYLNSDIPIKAMLALYDFCIESLNISKFIVHVLSDNKRAIRFNKGFGYKISDNQEDVYNQEYTLLKDEYITYREKIRKIYLKAL